MKWPPKREGACGNAPIPKLTTGLPQGNSGVAIPQACKHGTTRVELVPQGHTHYGKEICAVCGRFIRWSAKPLNVERQRLSAFRLAKLAMRPDLTGWERQFVRSVGGKKHLSPKQLEIVERLCTQYLERKTS